MLYAMTQQLQRHERKREAKVVYKSERKNFLYIISRVTSHNYANIWLIFSVPKRSRPYDL